MDGNIIKIEVEELYVNYADAFGNPMQEQTLQLADTLYKTNNRHLLHAIM